MDAPQTQYRVIERGRKLIVLDTQTNLPPKRACDIHPAGHYRDTAPAPVKQRAEAPADSRNLHSEHDEMEVRDTLEGFAESVFSRRSEGEGLNPASIGIGAFGFAMVLAMMIGGFTGFIVAAAAIIIAGNIAFRHVGKRG